MFNGFNLALSYKTALGAIILVLVTGGLYLLWNLPVNFQTDRLSLVISRNRRTAEQNSVNNANGFGEENLKKGIEVITPNGDEVWERGKQYNVSWSSTLPGDIEIHAVLVPASGVGQAMFHPSVFPEGAIDGSYTFNVPADISTGKYRVMILGGADCKVESTENCYLDISDKSFIIK